MGLFSREKLAIPESWQLMIVAWFMFGIAANVNGMADSLSSFLVSRFFLPIAPSTLVFAVLTVGIPLFIVAPINEEWVKNYFYRRLSDKGKSYYAFIMSFAFSGGEALLYWATGNPFGLSWGDLVGRTVFPFHVFNYFVSYRFNFDRKGQILATVFHSINNLSVFMIYYAPPQWAPISFYNLIYVANYLVMIAVSWHVLKKLSDVSTKAV